MESEKKKNIGLVGLVVVLIIMVFGLSGYIIYDKLLTNKSKETETFNKTTVSNTNEEKDTIKDTMSESDALSIGNELWEYAYSTYWASKPAWEVTSPNGSKCDTNNVSKIKAKYAPDFKANGPEPDWDYTLDTFMHCSGGRGSNQMYKETNLQVKDIQESKIIYTAKSEYCGSSFCTESKDTAKVIENDFIIIKQNDNWLISYFYLPN